MPRPALQHEKWGDSMKYNRWSCLLVCVILMLLSGCGASPEAGGDGEGQEHFPPVTDEDIAAATALLEEAVERREAIVNTSTEIVWSETFTPGQTYTGTAYYVSNKGSDGNDGLSPETAWATLDRVNKAALEHGDAVFFERGGTWRNTTVETKNGVTYSAYCAAAELAATAGVRCGGCAPVRTGHHRLGGSGCGYLLPGLLLELE